MSISSLHQNENLFKEPNHFDPDRYLNHPKMANEYVSSADYKNRDKSDLSFQLNAETDLLPYITMAMVQVVGVAQGST